MTPFKSAAVAQAFDSYPAPMRRKLLVMRELVFDGFAPVPTGALRLCIAAALTYHSSRRQR